MKSCSVQDIVCTYDIYLESHLWHLVSQILKSYSSKVEDELYLLLNENLLDKSAVADIAVVNVYLFVKSANAEIACAVTSLDEYGNICAKLDKVLCDMRSYKSCSTCYKHTLVFHVFAIHFFSILFLFDLLADFL